MKERLKSVPVSLQEKTALKSKFDALLENLNYTWQHCDNEWDFSSRRVVFVFSLSSRLYTKPETLILTVIYVSRSVQKFIKNPRKCFNMIPSSKFAFNRTSREIIKEISRQISKTSTATNSDAITRQENKMNLDLNTRDRHAGNNKWNKLSRLNNIR